MQREVEQAASELSRIAGASVNASIKLYGLEFATENAVIRIDVKPDGDDTVLLLWWINDDLSLIDPSTPVEWSIGVGAQVLAALGREPLVLQIGQLGPLRVWQLLLGNERVAGSLLKAQKWTTSLVLIDVLEDPSKPG